MSRTSLATRAYVEIKRRIDAAHFLPGQYVTEAAISGALEIGRTPVHQALQRLALEQLVEIIPRKGVVILPNPTDRIGYILDARIAIEPELARRAAERATPDNIAILKQILRGAARPHGGGEIERFLAEDRAFHGAVGDMAGNPVLKDFSASLHEQTERCWFLNYWRTLDVKASHEQHAEVAQAVTDRDPDRAASAMRAHLESLAKRFETVRLGEQR